MTYLVSVLSVLAILASAEGRFESLQTEDDSLSYILRHVTRADVIKIRERLSLQTPLRPDHNSEPLARFSRNSLPKFTPEVCQLCLTGIEYLYGVIAIGIDYPDLRDVLMGVCEELVSLSDPRMTIICPGILDLNAPHVFNIFRNTDIPEADACKLLNLCSKDDFLPSELRPKNSYKPPPIITESADSDKNPKDVDMLSTIKILQITDIHIDHQYSEGSATDCGLPLCCRDYWPGNGSAPKYGTYECNPPPSMVKLFIKNVLDQQKMQPDFIIYSGDNPPHSQWNETLESQLDNSRLVADMLTKLFPTTPIYPTIGNHEMFPTNLYYTNLRETQVFNEHFVKMWKTAAKFTAEQEKTLLKAGYYSTLIRPGLRLLAFNSNFGYTMNFYNILAKEEMPYREMRQFMENTLKNARANGEKVVLLNHHPVGRYDKILAYSYYIEDLCITYSGTIVLFIGGHTHRDEFKLIRELGTGKTRGVQFIAPSVTTMGHINPSARFYYLDPATFELQDYGQYRVDIAQAAKTGVLPPAQYAYSPRYEYGMKDLSPSSWHHFVDQMRSDDKLLQKFYGHHYGGSQTGDDAHCDFDCKVLTLCGLYEAPFDRYRQCVKTNGTAWLT